MTFGKRQLMVAAMVAALGTAVYLNWQFSGVEPVSVTDSQPSESVSKQLGQTTYVNTEVSGAKSEKSEVSKSEDSKNESSKKEKAKETVQEVSSVLTKEQQEYFSSERAKRAQSQDKAQEGLEDIIEGSTSETTKKEALKIAERLANDIKAEGDIEAEIKTKGFAECLVMINNGSCTVIVTKGNLNEATAVTIKDIVSRHAGIEFERITVTEI